MKSMICCIAVAIALTSVLVPPSAGMTVDRSRYNIILTRKPFGQPPPLKASSEYEPVPLAPPPSFVKTLHMCAITEVPGIGIRVGIVKKTAPQKSYSWLVGESEDGFTLLEADFVKESALLEKDGEQAWISMNDSSASSPASTSASRVRTPRTSSGVPPRPTRTPPRLAPGQISYAERLKRRREAAIRHREVKPPPELTPKQLEAKYKEVQMNLIRKGQPPLPIPLTPEMDAELVREGVLPPR